MLDYILKGQVEIAPPPEEEGIDIYYLPHHAVRREKPEDAKWRIVLTVPSRKPCTFS
jgi:hypothetical protein